MADHFWIVKTHGWKKVDIVVLGDSRLYRGISPQAMKTVLRGSQIINLGYSSGSLTPTMFREAERRLDENSDQKIIVLGVTPASLSTIAAKNEQYLTLKNKTAEYVFTQMYLVPITALFPPTNPWDLLLTVLGQKEELLTTGYFNEYFDDGWVASYVIPENPGYALVPYTDYFSKTQVSPEVVQGVIAQTKAWVEEGIVVFAFRVPSTTDMVQLEDEISGFNERMFVEQFISAGGIWFDIPVEPYDSYDGSHLHRQSAEQLSKDIAELIQDHLNK